VQVQLIEQSNSNATKQLLLPFVSRKIAIYSSILASSRLRRDGHELHEFSRIARIENANIR